MALFSTLDICGCGNSASGFSGFTISDGSTQQVIGDSDVILFSGGTGIDVAVSATDTVTITFDGAFSDLSDVDISGIGTGSIPVYNAVSGNWEMGTTSGFTCTDLNTCSIDALQDVTLGTPSAGSVLSWDTGTSALRSSSLIYNVAGPSAYSSTVNVASATYGTPGTLTFVEGDGINISGSAGPTFTVGIDTTGALSGQVLYYDGVSVGWTLLSGTFTCNLLSTCSITDLADVNTSGVSTNDFLQYNGTTWVPVANTFSCSDLNSCSVDDLSDVDTSGAASGDHLEYDGANWVPVTPPTIAVQEFTGVADGADTVNLSSPASAILLVFRNGRLWPTSEYTATTGATPSVQFTEVFGDTTGSATADTETVTVVYVTS